MDIAGVNTWESSGKLPACHWTSQNRQAEKLPDKESLNRERAKVTVLRELELAQLKETNYTPLVF